MRVAHLASKFGRVFANLDPSYQPIVLAPADEVSDARPARKGDKSGAAAGAHASGVVSVVHQMVGHDLGVRQQEVKLAQARGATQLPGAVVASVAELGDEAEPLEGIYECPRDEVTRRGRRH